MQSKILNHPALREICDEVPEVTWDEVGGLEDVKNRLKESVEWPLTKPNYSITLELSLQEG